MPVSVTKTAVLQNLLNNKNLTATLIPDGTTKTISKTGTLSASIRGHYTAVHFGELKPAPANDRRIKYSHYTTDNAFVWAHLKPGVVAVWSNNTPECDPVLYIETQNPRLAWCTAPTKQNGIPQSSTFTQIHALLTELAGASAGTAWSAKGETNKRYTQDTAASLGLVRYNAAGELELTPIGQNICGQNP